MNKQPNSYYCFVCGVKNVAGVHVNFYEDVNAEGKPEIVARFTGRPEHQGYPDRMHGGVSAGILDETMGRGINYQEGEQPVTWGVTAELHIRYRKPVPLGVELTARGRIVRDIHWVFEGAGEIYLPDGTVAIEASGKYVKLKLGDIAEADPGDLGWRVYGEDHEPASLTSPHMHAFLERWHAAVSTRDAHAVRALLAPDVVFRSPVAHTPYRGQDTVTFLLGNVVQVFQDFTYHREFIAGDSVTLEFSARVGDLDLKGVDVIKLDDMGRIADFEVMIRPASALMALGNEMAQRVS